MLTQLTIKNLAIVEHLELNFAQGMHAITGETGAGKSIIIDALSLALGERASPDQIRANQTQAEVTACFDLQKLPMVQQILHAQELPDEECVIRRIISSDGRSRAYINGQSVAAQQLKSLAPYLVQIHSQHQHHALLDSYFQRELLDEYAKHPDLLKAVASLHAQWELINRRIQELADIQEQESKLDLLNYQLQELETLNILPDELTQLDQQHNKLAKGQELLQISQRVASVLADTAQSDTPNVLQHLRLANTQIVALQKVAPELAAIHELLKQAIINVEEAACGLEIFNSKIDLDPSQLVNIENRLSAIHTLARKLKVTPALLHEHYAELCAQRLHLTTATEQLQALQQELQIIEQSYQQAARVLSLSRSAAAEHLTKAVMAKLKTLEMPNTVFAIMSEVNKNPNPSAYGNENIHFMIAANPGQPMGLIKKIASGGELSRISLAIQAITAQQTAIPTLILDEVDVGISGKTAAIVGALIRTLGANAQILCITHLPQVAAQGHHHFKVEKLQTKDQTTTKITPLSESARVQELARLMGGTAVTPEALAHAQKLLEATV